MGYLGATLTQVFTRACGQNKYVTQRCHNSPRWETEASEYKWRHALEVRGGFWEILKKSVSWELDTKRDGWLSLVRRDLCGGCHTCWGVGRWKSQNRKIVLLSLCRRTFKLKGNKKVRTWTKKLLRVFWISRSYVLCIYVMNVPCTFRIFMYMAMIHRDTTIRIHIYAET